ncbi:MAG: glycoside hydrolase, partial [Planctomycetaceae bacterium]|nr:glycoside hydrolase [Planctomycetaceae bacterium]
MKTQLFLTVLFFLLSTIISYGEELSRQKILDSVLEPPELFINPVTKYDDDHRNYNMNCGIAQTSGGRLWACSISGGDSADAYMVAFTSDDDGKTWSKPRLVIDPPELSNGVKRRVLIANFWTAPNGTLWLFFDYGLSMFDGRIGVWVTTCENPDADFPVWKKPVRICHGNLHNKPIVTKNGTWLIPIELYSREYTKWDFKNIFNNFNGFPELDGERGITIYASTNQGKTWTKRGCCVFPVSAGEEPMIVEKKDGTLWLLARTPKGLHQSFSNDQGETWNEPTPSFKNPVTRFFITRLVSGNLLFIRHGTFEGEEKNRAKLSAWISEDDGQTWKGGLMLDERSGVSYPDG